MIKNFKKVLFLIVCFYLIDLFLKKFCNFNITLSYLLLKIINKRFNN